MNVGFDFRRGVASLPDSLEYFAARVNVMWGKEHDPNTGGHTAITAASLAVSGGITAKSINISGDASIGGSLTLTGGLSVQSLVIKSDAPTLQFIETDQATDRQSWMARAQSGEFRIQSTSLDGVTRNDALLFSRSGLTPTAIRMFTPVGIGVAPMADSSAILQTYGGIAMTAAGQYCGFNLAYWAGAWRHFVNGWGWMINDTAGYLAINSAAENLSGAAQPATPVWRVAWHHTDGLMDVNGWGQLRANSTGFALNLIAAANGLSAIRFSNNAATGPLGDLVVSNQTFEFRLAIGQTLLWQQNWLYPNVHNAVNLGHTSYWWTNVHSVQYSAKTDGGYYFESNSTVGLSYMATGYIELRLGTPYMRLGAGDVLMLNRLVIQRGTPLSSGGLVVTGYPDCGLSHDTDSFYISNSSTCYLRLRRGDSYGGFVGNGFVSWTDNLALLGHPAHRFNTAYITNGVVTGSDARDKILSANPLGLDFIRKIETFSYQRPTDPSLHYGVVAQQLEAIGFGAIYHPKSSNEHYGLNYSELIAPIIKAIQELDQRVARAEDHIERSA